MYSITAGTTLHLPYTIVNELTAVCGDLKTCVLLVLHLYPQSVMVHVTSPTVRRYVLQKHILFMHIY